MVLDSILPASAQANRFTPTHEDVDNQTLLDRPSVPSAFESHTSRGASRKYVPPGVEIKGAGSADGQWQFLYRVAADMLLGSKPSPGTNQEDILQGTRDRDDHSQGVGGVIVWIDCFGRFDVLRLYKLMLSMTSKSRSEALEAEDSTAYPTVYAALDNLHVFSPDTSAQLLATVRSLESHLLNLQDKAAGDLPLRAIVISDVTSFYWEDRKKEEDQKTTSLAVPSRTETRSSPPLDEEPRPKRSIPFTVSSHHASLTSSLSRLSQTFCCPVLVSTISFHPVTFPQPLQGRAITETYPTLRSPLPSPWSRLVNIEITLQKQRSRRGVDSSMGSGEAMEAEQVLITQADAMKIRGWVDARKWIKTCLPEMVVEDEAIQLGVSKFKILIGRADIDITNDNG